MVFFSFCCEQVFRAQDDSSEKTQVDVDQKQKRRELMNAPDHQVKPKSADDGIVRLVRVRGGKFKLRALRLNHGNFAWRSEQATRKTRIVDVLYHAANNEYVRTKTLTKSAIIQIDATPFRQCNKKKKIGAISGKKKNNKKIKTQTEKFSKLQLNQFRRRQSKQNVPENIIQQFKTGRLLAALSSKPGQVGRADGYILEGDELEKKEIVLFNLSQLAFLFLFFQCGLFVFFKIPFFKSSQKKEVDNKGLGCIF
ncbi:Ribosomal protein S8, component of cytosolic 80S ribosome and 40S small subunit [Reticulomyxa filosa]|uniref:40S ribosomal protein S8 n=1 Tax=Reticulomyxa filosa TaxID=46433 RepID=X6NF08_RETFI|nr:Ribosomal protein S8, component of cytosolic 80S ribosome and 40S small subunit [Reticulomyxa filosa]|eukprot:ETO23912.1 Ribosomal protein S8, component of cytosolic 80S ribosome and 40S small subunit [Reticulomyxa filosa]